MSGKTNKQIAQTILIVAVLGFYAASATTFFKTGAIVTASENASETAQPQNRAVDDDFDQQAALARLREQIKGREKEPAGQVFKNIQVLKEMPAGRLLSVMEMGYSRSLGTNCTHCHTPENWELDAQPAKQVAREMIQMMGVINTQLLKNVKNLKSTNPLVNCTTCHRGETKPALNLPAVKQ